MYAIIEYLQLLFFPLNSYSNYGWYSVITFFRDDFSQNTFFLPLEAVSGALLPSITGSSGVIVYCVVVLLVLLMMFAIGAVMQFHDPSKSSQNASTFVRVAWNSCILISNALTVPIILYLLSSLSCDNYVFGQTPDVAVCAIFSLFSGVALFSFILANLVIVSFVFDSDPMSHSPTARLHSKTEIFKLLVKIVLPLYYVVSQGKNPWLSWLICLITSTLMFGGYVYTLPFFKFKMNQIQAALSAVFVWASLSLGIKLIFQSLSGLVIVIFAPGIAFLGYFSCLSRKLALLEKIVSFSSVGSVFELDAAVRLFTASKEGGEITTKSEEERTSHCVEWYAKHEEEYRDENFFWLSRARFSLVNAKSVHYGMKYLENLNNPIWDIQSVEYSIRKLIEKEIDKSSVGKDLLKFLEFEKSKSKARNADMETCHAILTFWTELRSSGELTPRIAQFSSNISHWTKQAIDLYKELIKIGPTDHESHKMFASFLDDILNDTRGFRELMEQADSIRKATQKTHDHHVHSSIIIAEGQDDGQMGRIIAMNEKALDAFGYSKEQVQNMKLNDIMPWPFSIHHDYFLRRYLDTGKSSLLGTNRVLVGQKASGYLLPVKVLVRALIRNSRRLTYAATLDPTDPDGMYAILDGKMAIVSISYSMSRSIKKSLSMCRGMKFEEFFPGFSLRKYGKGPGSLFDVENRKFHCRIAMLKFRETMCVLVRLQELHKQPPGKDTFFEKIGKWKNLIEPGAKEDGAEAQFWGSIGSWATLALNKGDARNVVLTDKQIDESQEEKSADESSIDSQPFFEQIDSWSNNIDNPKPIIYPDLKHHRKQFLHALSSDAKHANKVSTESSDQTSTGISKTSTSTSHTEESLQDPKFQRRKSTDQKSVASSSQTSAMHTLISTLATQEDSEFTGFRKILGSGLIGIALFAILQFAAKTVEFKSLNNLFDDLVTSGSRKFSSVSLQFGTYGLMYQQVDTGYHHSEEYYRYLLFHYKNKLHDEMNLFFQDATAYENAMSTGEFKNEDVTLYFLRAEGIQADNKTLFQAINELVNEAALVTDPIIYPIERITKNDPAPFFLYANGNNHVTEKLRGSTDAYQNFISDEISRYQNTGLWLLIGACGFIAFIWVFGIIPIINEVESNKREVMEIFLELKPGLIKNLEERVKNRLDIWFPDMAQVVEDDFDFNPSRSKKRQPRSRYSRLHDYIKRFGIMLKFSLILLISSAFFVVIYTLSNNQLAQIDEISSDFVLHLERRFLCRSVLTRTLELSSYKYNLTDPMERNTYEMQQEMLASELDTLFEIDTVVTTDAFESNLAHPDELKELLIRNGCVSHGTASQEAILAGREQGCHLYLQHGLTSGVSLYLEKAWLMFNQIKAIPSSSLNNTAFVEAPRLEDMMSFETQYLQDSLKSEINFQLEGLLMTMKKFSDTVVYCLIAFVGFLILTYFSFYQSLIRELEEQLRRTRRLLLMIPPEIITTIPRLSSYLQKMSKRISKSK